MFGKGESCPVSLGGPGSGRTLASESQGRGVPALSPEK